MARELGIAYLAVAVLGVVAAVPLLLGWVRRNSWYGVRVGQAYRSPRHWYLVNRYGGRRMALWSGPIILAGLVALVIPLQDRPLVATLLAFAPLLVLVPTAESIRYARRLPAEAERLPPTPEEARRSGQAEDAKGLDDPRG